MFILRKTKVLENYFKLFLIFFKASFCLYNVEDEGVRKLL